MTSDLTFGERARLSLLRIDRSAALGLAVLAALAVVATVLFVSQHRTREVAFTGDGSPVVAASAGPTASADPVASVNTGEVVVDVAGRVREPGLVRVPKGSRVADVIEAAGGFTRRKDAATVNQARVVSDGEQVVVGGGGVAPPGGAVAGGGGAPGSPAQPIDLNNATLAELETLPGVGPVLAQRILDHRTTNGRFSSVDELRDVSGIGDKTFADLAPRVRV